MRVAALTVLAMVIWAAAPAQAHAVFGPLGADLRISFLGPNGNTNFDAETTDVAYNPDRNEYLVVYRGDDNTAPLIDEAFEIFAQRLSATGSLLGGRVRVSDMGPDNDSVFDAFGPSVVYNALDNQYLVIWVGDDDTGALDDDELEVYAQRLNDLGAEIGDNDIRVSAMGPDGDDAIDAAGASVAWNSVSNEYLLTWRAADDTPPLVTGEQEVFGQRVSAAGAELGGAGGDDFRISEMGTNGNPAFDAGSPSVAFNSAANQWLVTWHGEDLVDGEDDVYGQLLNTSGAEVGTNDFRISDMGPNGDVNYDAEAPTVAYNSSDNQYLVTWVGDDNIAPLVESEEEVFGQLLSGAGAELGANDFRVTDMGPNGTPGYDVDQPELAYHPSANQYLVAWRARVDDAPVGNFEFEIFGQVLSATGGQPGTNDFRISDMGPDGNENFTAEFVSVEHNPASGEYLVTWDGDDNTAPLVDEEYEIFAQRVADLPAPPGGGPPPPPGGGPPADTVAPRVLTVSLSPRKFAAFRSGPSVRPARTRGTRITYGLSEAAQTTFRVQRVLPGRRVKGRCVRPKRSNRANPRCKRYRTLRGRFSHAGAAGTNRLRFSGRLAGRRLPPGSYRLVARATDAAGNRSTPVRRAFRIVPRRRPRPAL